MQLGNQLKVCCGSKICSFQTLVCTTPYSAVIKAYNIKVIGEFVLLKCTVAQRNAFIGHILRITACGFQLCCVLKVRYDLI